jgi:hypothetical protein
MKLLTSRDLKVKMFDTDESVKDKYENQMMHQISVDTPRVSKTISIFQLSQVLSSIPYHFYVHSDE